VILALNEQQQESGTYYVSMKSESMSIQETQQEIDNGVTEPVNAMPASRGGMIESPLLLGETLQRRIDSRGPTEPINRLNKESVVVATSSRDHVNRCRCTAVVER
jgi:hypothetical protein